MKLKFIPQFIDMPNNSCYIVITIPSALESASSIKELCRLAKFKLVPSEQWDVAEPPSIKASGTVEDIQIVGFFISELSECAYHFIKKKAF